MGNLRQATSRLRRSVRGFLLCLMLAAGPAIAAAQLPEYQLKAVFLFNFALFVDWPADAFADPAAPLVVGVLGDDPFGPLLDEAVRGESAHGRPLIVRRFRRIEDVDTCHILFISRGTAEPAREIITRLQNRSILTVGEFAGFARDGGVIGFSRDSNRVRLQINVDAAKKAGLELSSKLLRPAVIVTSEGG